LAKKPSRPVHDHLYWANEVSAFNTHKERQDYLKQFEFSQGHIDAITHLCVFWLPKRMHGLPNRLLNAAYKDLPNDTARTTFRIGIENMRKKL